jgi:plasmid maintenance system antidote protein VapI
MKIFEFADYRDFVTQTVRSLPKRGRGELLKIARHLEIHSSTLSQVLSGIKHFTLDQACALADYFGFNDLETQYLLHLVELERAGTPRLRATLKKHLLRLQQQSRALSAMIPGKKTLSEEQKAIFYSNWFYTGIWALTSISGYQTSDAISRYFGLPKQLVNGVISFLLSTGLCVEESGLLRPGTTYVHLEADSPLIGRHHASWRQKAVERHPILAENEIAYSSPMSISLEDAQKVRKLILGWVEQVNKLREPSPCEVLYFLNIDWVKF